MEGSPRAKSLTVEVQGKKRERGKVSMLRVRDVKKRVGKTRARPEKPIVIARNPTMAKQPKPVYY